MHLKKAETRITHIFYKDLQNIKNIVHHDRLIHRSDFNASVGKLSLQNVRDNK